MATLLTLSCQFRWCETANKYSFMLYCSDTSQSTLLAESLRSFLNKSGKRKRLCRHLQIPLVCQSSSDLDKSDEFQTGWTSFICARTHSLKFYWLYLHPRSIAKQIDTASISCRNFGTIIDWTFSFRKNGKCTPIWDGFCFGPWWLFHEKGLSLQPDLW